MSKELRMPNVGDTLKGQYQLKSVLGVGGGGKAFSGIDNENNNPIAVKVLKLPLSYSHHEFLQFSKEAFRMLKFAHPNLVKVIDYDSDEDTLPYIVMPLAANGSLDKEIETRRGKVEQVPLARSIEAIEQIGDALEYLHQKRIIHQDVKPHNILVPNETDFWLSDLGIAKILNPLKPSETGGFAGTRVYAAPEQFKDKAVFASDQYSLGVAAYHLLTGGYPFTGLQAEMRGKGIEVKPLTFLEAMQQLNLGKSMYDILRALDPIIMKTLAMQPEERYNSVTTFTKTLKKTVEEAQGIKRGKPFSGVDVKKQSETSPMKIEDLIKQCVALFEGKNFPELERVSEKAIQLDPDNPDAWCYRGLSMCTYDKFEEAIPFYDRVLEIDPLDVNAIWNKGNCLEKLDRPTEALPILNRALQIDPTYDLAWFDKGNALRALGRKEEAIVAYDQAIRINPKDSDMYNNKGAALNELGRNEEAIVAYDQAIRINPQYSDTYYNKGAALNELGRNEEAIVAYDQAIRINPQYSDAYVRKGVVLAVLGRKEEAIAVYDQAIRINPKDSDTYYNKGNALRALGRKEEAIASFEKAVELDPSDKEAQHNIDIIKGELGQKSKKRSWRDMFKKNI